MTTTITATCTDDLYSQCLIISSANGHASIFEWMTEIAGMDYDEAADILERMKGEGLLEDMGRFKTFAKLKGYEE